MATIILQHVHHLGRHLGVFKNFIFSKNAANFLKISRKHVFRASNMNIIKNRVEKQKLKQIFPKSYSFRFQTSICIINSASIISDDIIQFI